VLALLDEEKKIIQGIFLLSIKNILSSLQARINASCAQHTRFPE